MSSQATKGKLPEGGRQKKKNPTRDATEVSTLPPPNSSPYLV